MNYTYLLVICLAVSSKIFSQDIFIYHGSKAEGVQILDQSKHLLKKGKIMMVEKGESITINILNPNTIFYNYEFKQENIDIKDDNPDISALLSALNVALSSSASAGVGSAEYSTYKSAIQALAGEIQTAKNIITKSDDPGLKQDAIDGKPTGGVLLAFNEINNPTRLSSNKYHFNSSTLKSDLDELLTAVTGLDDMQTKAFIALNDQYVQKVKELTNIFQSSNFQTTISKEFTATTDKKTKITLIITEVTKGAAKRQVGEFEITTIEQYYDRATVELIPIGNLVFASNIPRFFLDNNIVSRKTDDTVGIYPGLLLNVNTPSFGTKKEMAVGVGFGYNLSKNSNIFKHLSFNALFSYRNYIRIGAGVGFAQMPKELKDGVKENSPLPSTIPDLNNVIKYDAKLCGFLIFSFTGLKIGK